MPNYCETCVVVYNMEVFGKEKQAQVMKAADDNGNNLFKTLYPEPLYSEGNEAWRRAFWGCSSESHRNTIMWNENRHGHVIFRFQSSWSPPIELFRNLSKEVGLEWELAYCVEFSREAAGYTRHDWNEVKDIRDFYYPKGNEPLSVITLFEQGVYFKHEMPFDWSHPGDD